METVEHDVKNKIGQHLETIAPDHFHIAPKKEFFKQIGIRQKRWGQLVRDEKQATIEEFIRISKYFGIPLRELINQKNFAALQNSIDEVKH